MGDTNRSPSVSGSSDEVFGESLRALRRAARMTQAELAERANLSIRGLSDLERGINRHPRRETLLALADAFELAEDERARFFSSARGRPVLAAPKEVEAAGSHHVAEPLQAVGNFLWSRPEHRLVARKPEMRQLLSALDAVQAGTGRVCFLVGEPGVGKTRLAQEVSLVARERGFLIITGRCYAPPRDGALLPLPGGTLPRLLLRLRHGARGAADPLAPGGPTPPRA